MAKIRPAVNQIEVHPLMIQEENIAYNHSLGIQVEAWGPFGQGDIDAIGHPLLQSLAAKYQKTASQIVLLDRLFYSNLHTDWTMKVGASVSIARRGGATTMVFRQLDEHTWIGNGHRVYNESLFVISL